MSHSAGVLRVRNVTVKAGDATLLDNVSCDARTGQVTAVIGPNGAGKTTLLRAILGLIPHTGEIQFFRDGQTPRRPCFGYVPQHIEFDRTAPMTVLDFFALSGQLRPVFLGRTRRVRDEADAALARTGVCHLMHHPLGKLSGGEFQRVLLALALRDHPDILMLDEPISGVDVAGLEMFSEILDALHEDGQFAMLLVSHDLSMVHRHADSVICLNRRVIEQGAVTKVLTPQNLAEVFGPEAHLIEHPALRRASVGVGGP